MISQHAITILLLLLLIVVTIIILSLALKDSGDESPPGPGPPPIHYDYDCDPEMGCGKVPVPGQYTTLDACKSSCLTPTPPGPPPLLYGYDCDDNKRCVKVRAPGQYITLDICKSHCITPPPPSTPPPSTPPPPPSTPPPSVPPPSTPPPSVPPPPSSYPIPTPSDPTPDSCKSGESSFRTLNSQCSCPINKIPDYDEIFKPYDTPVGAAYETEIKIFNNHSTRAYFLHTGDPPETVQAKGYAEPQQMYRWKIPQGTNPKRTYIFAGIPQSWGKWHHGAHIDVGGQGLKYATLLETDASPWPSSAPPASIPGQRTWDYDHSTFNYFPGIPEYAVFRDKDQKRWQYHATQCRGGARYTGFKGCGMLDGCSPMSTILTDPNSDFQACVGNTTCADSGSNLCTTCYKPPGNICGEAGCGDPQRQKSWVDWQIAHGNGWFYTWPRDDCAACLSECRGPGGVPAPASDCNSECNIETCANNPFPSDPKRPWCEPLANVYTGTDPTDVITYLDVVYDPECGKWKWSGPAPPIAGPGGYNCNSDSKLCEYATDGKYPIEEFKQCKDVCRGPVSHQVGFNMSMNYVVGGGTTWNPVPLSLTENQVKAANDQGLYDFRTWEFQDMIEAQYSPATNAYQTDQANTYKNKFLVPGSKNRLLSTFLYYNDDCHNNQPIKKGCPPDLGKAYPAGLGGNIWSGSKGDLGIELMEYIRTHPTLNRIQLDMLQLDNKLGQQNPTETHLVLALYNLACQSNTSCTFATRVKGTPTSIKDQMSKLYTERIKPFITALGPINDNRKKEGLPVIDLVIPAQPDIQNNMFDLKAAAVPPMTDAMTWWNEGGGKNLMKPNFLDKIMTLANNYNVKVYFAHTMYPCNYPGYTASDCDTVDSPQKMQKYIDRYNQSVYDNKKEIYDNVGSPASLLISEFGWPHSCEAGETNPCLQGNSNEENQCSAWKNMVYSDDMSEVPVYYWALSTDHGDQCYLTGKGGEAGRWNGWKMINAADNGLRCPIPT